MVRVHLGPPSFALRASGGAQPAVTGCSRVALRGFNEELREAGRIAFGAAQTKPRLGEGAFPLLFFESSGL